MVHDYINPTKTLILFLGSSMTTLAQPVSLPPPTDRLSVLLATLYLGGL